MIDSAAFLTTPDGRRLRTFASGPLDAGTVVVLEAGLGASGLYWGLVHLMLAERVRVVAYERAGYGESTPDPAPRTLERLADDLDAVVNAQEPARLVLVGHSWGGPIVRRLAARRLAAGAPMDGVVLVDQSDEHAALYFRPSTRRLFAFSAAVLEPAARLGLLRVQLRSLVDGMDPIAAAQALDASTNPAAARAAAAEQRMVGSELAGLRSRPPRLGDLPMRVISGMQETPADRTRGPLITAHLETVAAHPGAVHVRAERSGHVITASEPELVAQQVLELALHAGDRGVDSRASGDDSSI
ncbi:alpha/beta hydrolase [Pseudoclavibacter sp. RFBJ3]|uniref:alpha/beta fold hydrolase n=1 Tax=unclassified Pseudoclavibacter TaxID=2615177 RepID=UPI000CE7C5E3|nr:MULTISPECIES: alpha/beta fold hydrolase [unclassified Pseudoclavibacter]PPF81539.1 alpha/beta hydrolase [Pseudoclavibacter sp. RFBJ5]PPF90869.1 alpha/beta hydrolase [Pseudoclavibacter sp. RFBJ3]PPG00145.1 alpha/beta hydrolase [Pseudoclavibacter sp. RFBH5]PPG20003.1 alpha/beta hydrolase [Pseudoclavibacter sp. RFBI4]